MDDIDLHQMIYNGLHLSVAYLMALPVAWDREKATRSAGLRTFPLVSVAACGYLLTGATSMSGDDAHSRVVYGIITGIGFIGGGAILKDKGRVSGTATAAGIWCTGAIGIAVAFKNYEIAFLVSLFSFLTFKLKPVAKSLADHRQGKSQED